MVEALYSVSKQTEKDPASPRKNTAFVSQSGVALRRFPYPYRAMLAVCSDLDETAGKETYLELMRFLNTRESTTLGAGVGLEVGNSIYFDMAPAQFAYWNTDDGGREMVRELIRSGHIDCLHSYGDLASNRSHALRALEELARHHLSLKVWVDHAQAPTNLGADIMQGHGDEPDHPAYHADLTVAQGVRYVWRGRVTSVIGQNAAPDLRGLWRSSSAIASSRTLAKEAAKIALGHAGSRKYRLHAGNQILNSIQLRDGQIVDEFLRSNPHPAGVDVGDTGAAIGEVLTRNFLDQLVAREGVTLLYTHLGKLNGRPLAVRAFRLLAEYAAERQILVTTTRRLLDYLKLTQTVTFSSGDDSHVLNVEGVPSFRSEELQGLTFYTSSPVREVRVNGCAVSMQSNSPDHTGCASVSIPWEWLRFPSF